MTTCIANDLFIKTLVKRKIINIPQEKAQRIAFMMTKILPAVFGIICVLMTLHPPQFMGVMVWIGISGVASATLAPMLLLLSGLNVLMLLPLSGERLQEKQLTWLFICLLILKKALWQPVPGG